MQGCHFVVQIRIADRRADLKNNGGAAGQF